jgi:hypothetical protein
MDRQKELKVHCGIKEMFEVMKNRVSQFFQVQFGSYVQVAGNFKFNHEACLSDANSLSL